MTEQISNAVTADHGVATKDESEDWKQWAVLIYLGGANNLFDEMVFAVKEMKSSVPNQSVTQQEPATQQDATEFNFRALVQFAAEETSRPTSAFSLPRRFILTPGDTGLGKDYFKPLEQPSEPEPPSAIEAYKEELIDFLVWGISNGKAKHYMVIFSGHGLGIESDFLTEDMTPPRSLTVKDLRDVLSDERVRDALGENTIDILGLDSCLMAMAEVGFELREAVPIMVASQGSEANLGWPYKDIFARLHERLKTGGRPLYPEEVAQIILDKFVPYYDDFACAADSSADIAAWRLREGNHYYMEELKAAVDSLAKACLSIIRATKYERITWEPSSNEFAKSLIFAHWYAQAYHSDQYADIYDFCDVLMKNLPHCDGYEAIKKSCERVMDIVIACTIQGDLPRRFSGPLYQYAFGVSIYFPWSVIYPLYDAEHLDFLKYGQWYEFVQAYTKFTRRPPRDVLAISARYEGTKDFPPRSKGVDDPSARAKNPPSLWKVGDEYKCELKPIIIEDE